jgi:hypothetical protein
LETPYYFDRRGEIGRQSAPAPGHSAEHAAPHSVAVNVAPKAASSPRQDDNNDRIAAVLGNLLQEMNASRKRN